jgi:hypothetical protein
MTKRRLQGTLAKAKELWEARKRSKRHPPDEPQPEVALSSTVDALTQAQDPLLTAANTCPSGGDVTMDLAGIADTVCGETAAVVH